MEEASAACIIEQTSAIAAPGITAECASCYTQSLLCNLRCIAECSTDAESEKCVACQHATGCRGLFHQCSGLEPMD